ncbi:MAG: hypothetical protein AABY10_02340 [Nanoarchaeota archaeon]
MLPKGDAKIVVYVVMVLAFLLFTGSMIMSIKNNYFDLHGKSWVCATSLRLNANLLYYFKMTLLGEKSLLPATPPTACAPQSFMIEGTPEVVVRKIVKLAGECWETYGTIKANVLKKRWFFAINSYDTCFNFKINLDRTDKISMDYLLGALNTPLNLVLDNSEFPEKSFIQYTEDTGLYGGKVRVDRNFVNEGNVYDYQSKECEKKSCTYYIKFYDGHDRQDPDRLIISDNYAFTGEEKTSLTYSELITKVIKHA